jgi:alpha-N-arabinofuranosidase
MVPCLFVLGLGFAHCGCDGASEGTQLAEPESIRITREPLVGGEISPFQYGQFIEYLCDLVPGMWAEKLYDGSFEGLSPYKFAFIRQTDFREKPWYPSGAVNRAAFTLDPDSPVSGKVAQKIEVAGGSPCTIGISQDGIAVESGMQCDFSCYLRQRGIQLPVRVRLHHEGSIFAELQFLPTDKWKKYHGRLVPRACSRNTTLTIESHGPGTLWLDNASLMPADNIGGWRPDVVQALRELKPGIIRFGGSALEEVDFGDFEWRDTIGAINRRKPLRAWGGLQPMGAGLEEIVQLCRRVDAEPLLCVRFSGRSPQDAADEVEYFNGAADSPMGRLRARNGHAEEYRIKYWQVGNERAGPDYDAKLEAFCRAMKKADPHIKLLSSYPRPSVLERARKWLDYACPHHYDIADLTGAENDFRAIRARIVQCAPDSMMKIAVTEWNTTGGDWGPKRARLWTLENALACARYHNLLHRHADVVEIANRSNLTNSFCSGVIQTDNARLYKTPTYYAQQLYATLAGNRPLKVESAVPNRLPDVSATLSAAGDSVTLFAVNDSLNVETRKLDFSAFGIGGHDVSVWTLADAQRAGEPDVTNSFDMPRRVMVVQSAFQANSPQFGYSFPPLSLTVLRSRVGK